MAAALSLPVLACSLQARCDLHAVRDICRQARDFLTTLALPESDLDAWELTLAEATNNAVHHCRPAARTQPIHLSVLASVDWVEVRVTDHTPGFDWPVKAALPPDDSEDGRGIFLIQSLTDEAHYLRGQEENCLVLRKKHPRSQPVPPVWQQADATRDLREARHTLDLMTEELASAYESLAAIFRFSAELHDSVTSPDSLQRWLNQLLTITEADWFVLRLVDRDSRHLHVSTGSDPAWTSPPLPLAATLERHLESQAAAQRIDMWFDAHTPLAETDPLCSLVARGCGFSHPLFVHETLVGVLSMGRRDSARPFQAGQVSVIQTFGDFLALQIRSTQMQEEQLQARLNQRDLEIASKIQRTLLPEQLAAVPHSALAGFYRSAREIGGDYYDVLPVGENNVLLVVADVMGKGLPAALFAFMFRSLVRARRDLAAQPGVLLAWLNQNLFQELDRAEMFITAQLAFLDTVKGEFRVASAGHPPLLLAHAHGAITEVSAGGPPLGIVAGARFPEEAHPSAGTHTLMFTDGLIEARNREGDLLGLGPVKAALAHSAQTGESSEACRQRLASLLQQFEHGTPPADDTAFIVINHQQTSHHG